VKVLQTKVKNAFLLTKMQGDFVVVDSNAKGVRRTWSEVVERGALGSNECNMSAKRVQQGLHLAAGESTANTAKASMGSRRRDSQKGHITAVCNTKLGANGRGGSHSSEKDACNKASKTTAKVARAKAEVEWVMPKPRPKKVVTPIIDTQPAMIAKVKTVGDWVMSKDQTQQPNLLSDRKDRPKPGPNVQVATTAHSAVTNRRGEAKRMLKETVKVIERMVAKIETPCNIRRRGVSGYVEDGVSDADAEEEAKVCKTLFKCFQTLSKVKGYGTGQGILSKGYNPSILGTIKENVEDLW